MELNRLTEETKTEGQDNQAFEPEKDQIQVPVEDVNKDRHRTAEESVSGFLEKKKEKLQEFCQPHRDQIRLAVVLVLAAGFIAMVIAACIFNFQRAIGLLVITLVTLFFLAWDWLIERYGHQVWDELSPIREFWNRNLKWIRWVVCLSMLIGVVCWLALDTAKQGKRQMVSFVGLLFFISLMVLFSKNPFKISWRTLLCGTGLQFVIGLLILRTRGGSAAVAWLGNQVEIFLSYTDVGSKFVFGKTFQDHFIVFKVLPVLVFLSTVISMLQYVGFMPWLIRKVGFIMQGAMGTSPPESLAAAGNIFLGQSESALLIRPYIAQLTMSELHAVLTGGFASIAGTVLGAFISFGISPSHLLTASVMSAPASLAIAKTFWPETEQAKETTSSNLKLNKGETTNLLEAASYGASSSVVLLANIVVNLIAFLALLAFFDAALSWLGGMFDYPQLSFSMICSYVFMPFSFMMGVSWEDSFIVAELIGLKTFFNEFLAYEKLSALIKMRKAGEPKYVDNIKQYLSVHSETIATYSLCGFANLSSLGMMIGAMSAIAPGRRADICRCGFRALIAGTVACFMTACVAGVLYIPEFSCQDFLEKHFSSTSMANSTQLEQCCTQLYDSVMLNGTWNVTTVGGFSKAALLGCCLVKPPTLFNCSLAF